MEDLQDQAHLARVQGHLSIDTEQGVLAVAAEVKQLGHELRKLLDRLADKHSEQLVLRYDRAATADTRVSSISLSLRLAQVHRCGARTVVIAIGQQQESSQPTAISKVSIVLVEGQWRQLDHYWCLDITWSQQRGLASDGHSNETRIAPVAKRVLPRCRIVASRQLREGADAAQSEGAGRGAGVETGHPLQKTHELTHQTALIAHYKLPTIVCQ